MIARLVGTFVSHDGSRAVIDVRDIGYAVHAAGKDLEAWAAADGNLVIHVSTDVREDAITLYGFREDLDRVVFTKLRTVSGVGPKVALATLDTLGRQGLADAVSEGDVKMLCRIPGVGKKLAQRLALELKGKLPLLPTATADAAPAPKRSEADDMLALALARLGYGRSEINRARKALESQELGEDTPLPERIKAALKVLSG
jgi:Holliday junction DNA helicase RuvA